MSKVYKTARGKTIDMDKVKLANETVTAVGNMKVNARGDKLGHGGQVVAGRNQVMDRVYAVGSNPVPSGGYSPNDPDEYAQQQQMAESQRARDLHNLATTLVKPMSIETNETTESDLATTPARGSLASSVAKTVVVKQEPMPDPKKSNGPTRI